MLLPRFLTALIGMPLVVLAIWWGQIPFAVLFFGISLLALQEYYALAEEAGWPVFRRLGLILGGVLALSILLFGTKIGFTRMDQSEIYFISAAVTGVLSTLILAALFSPQREQAFLGVGITFLGIFYVIWGLSHLYLIRDMRPDGKAYAFFLFLTVWAMDIGAYLGGRQFGKRKLYEGVSPKKTWEGLLTGIASSLIAAQVSRVLFPSPITVFRALTLGLFVGVLAQLSDLSESLFKRNVGVKDSGGLLPGHGGLLDRFDSFLLTAPIYYYALVFLSKS